MSQRSPISNTGRDVNQTYLDSIRNIIRKEQERERSLLADNATLHSHLAEHLQSQDRVCE